MKRIAKHDKVIEYLEGVTRTSPLSVSVGIMITNPSKYAQSLSRQLKLTNREIIYRTSIRHATTFKNAMDRQSNNEAKN